MSLDYVWQGTKPRGVPNSPALGLDTTTNTLYVSNPATGWQGIGGSTLSNNGSTLSVGITPYGFKLTDGGNTILAIPNVLMAISSSGFVEIFDGNSDSIQIGGPQTNWAIANGSGGAFIQNPVGGNMIQIHGGVFVDNAAPVTSAGQLGIGNGTAATATSGSGTLPAQPAGFLVFNLAGTAIKIPYYNA